MPDFPVFVLAPPRSGTRLLSQMLARSRDTYLITEHKQNKPAEEINTVSDRQFWMTATGLPNLPSEEVSYEKVAFERLYNLWRAGAGNQRLLIKNPQNVARIAAIRQAFPSARFVWLIRDPWYSIQSMLGGDNAGGKTHKFVRTRSTIEFSDPILQCASSWVLALDKMDEFSSSGDAIVRYEDLLSDPKGQMERLSDALGLSGAIENGAASIPRAGRSNLGLMTYLLNRCDDREAVVALLAERARALGYPELPNGSAKDVWTQRIKYFARWRRKHEWQLPYGFPKILKARAIIRSLRGGRS